MKTIKELITDDLYLEMPIENKGKFKVGVFQGINYPGINIVFISQSRKYNEHIPAVLFEYDNENDALNVLIWNQKQADYMHKEVISLKEEN